MHVLLALTAVVITGRVLGKLLASIGQPPVVGDILAGILLGPSLLGRVSPDLAAVILPRLLAVTHDAEEAARLTMPILCIVGDRDPLFPPPSIRALADLLPDARVVEISGCGHSPYFEDSTAWNVAVRQFFDHL